MRGKSGELSEIFLRDSILLPHGQTQSSLQTGSVSWPALATESRWILQGQEAKRPLAFSIQVSLIINQDLLIKRCKVG